MELSPLRESIYYGGAICGTHSDVWFLNTKTPTLGSFNFTLEKIIVLW